MKGYVTIKDLNHGHLYKTGTTKRT